MTFNIVRFATFEKESIEKNTIKFDRELRKYCVPCVNFKKPLCPPTFPYQENKVQCYTRFRLIYAKLDFKEYKLYRARFHPDWTEKQLGNSRLWQPSLKKFLRKYISQYSFKYMLGCGAGMPPYGSMEAGGINVFETCENNYIYLEGKFLESIEHYIHLVCLLMS